MLFFIPPEPPIFVTHKFKQIAFMNALKFNRFTLLFFALTLLFPSLLNAQFPHTKSYHIDPGAIERNRNIDVTKMSLEVSFAPEKGKVFGKVTHTFQSLQSKVDTIFLNAPMIEFHVVELDGKPVRFRPNKEGIIIESNLKDDYQKEHTLFIDYTATPQRGLYFIGWNIPKKEITSPAHMTRHQIWTQGQGIDNRHWIPMIDDRSDKFITETIITFEEDYNVLSNGELKKVTRNKKEGTKTWHYALENQHAGYLLMLAIDQYAIKKSKDANGVEHQFWYYPEHPERVEPTSRYSEKILEFLASEIGVPYPWGKTYSQVMVQDFLYGAMENTSATVFGDFFWVDDRAYLLNRNYVSVNAHEATHMWFGDLITGRKDSEHWLQESFATFYPGLAEAHLFTDEHKYWYFRNNMNAAIAAGKANSLPVRHSQSGSSRHYPKGASVLYMLQHQMGRENFRRGIQLYLNRHKYQNVETNDLQKAMIDATGINVDAFFDQWIHRGGEPIFQVLTNQNDKQLFLTVNQTHELDPVVRLFETPVDIAIYYKSGEVSRKTIQVSKASEIFTFNLSGEVDFVLFDEGSFILKKLDFNKSNQAYLAQFEKAEYMLDRYDALVALRSAAPNFKRRALVKAFKRETFHAIRAEIASQMLEDPQLAVGVWPMIADDAQAQVRLVYAQKAIIGENNVPRFEKLLVDSSYVIINTVLNRIWDHPLFAEKQFDILEKIKDVDGFTHDIKIKYLELANPLYPKMGQGMRNALVDMAGPKYEFRTRTLALQALQRMNYLDAALCHNLFEACTNFNSRLNSPANQVLNYFLTQTEKKALLQSEMKNFQSDDPKSMRLRSRVTK